MAHDLHFITSISGKTEAGHEIRGSLHTQLIAQTDFVETWLLMLLGKKPSASQKKVFNACLVACIDHGVSPASGFVPRVSVANGNPITTALAAGMLVQGPYHGGAISETMYLLTQIANETKDVEQYCRDLIKQARATHQRISGYGHAEHRDEDPRTQALFDVARNSGLNSRYIGLARTLEHVLEQEMGRKLVLNVDGAVATILLEIGLTPIAGDAVFALARSAGSLAHCTEEYERGEKVRRLPEENIDYQPLPSRRE